MRKFWDTSTPGAGESLSATQTVPVPSSVTIGSVRIAPATVLAPMAGVTDTVFRRFIRNLGGCGLIMTEFTSADGILRSKDKKAKLYLHFYEDEHPISAQLFGSDPKVMAEAARPALTSVDMNLEALGREAGASLMEMMGGRALKGVRRLPCSLVIRDSCGAHRPRAERGKQS